MVQHFVVYQVTLLLIGEAEKESVFSWFATSTALTELQLHTYFQKLKATTEELCEVFNLKVDHLFIIKIVIRLEVKSGISNIKDAIDLNKRQYLLHLKFLLKEYKF